MHPILSRSIRYSLENCAINFDQDIVCNCFHGLTLNNSLTCNGVLPCLATLHQVHACTLKMHLPFPQSDVAELDMKADVNTVGTDEHIADSKNVPLHKPEVGCMYM